jgi:hypothetical protein
MAFGAGLSPLPVREDEAGDDEDGGYEDVDHVDNSVRNPGFAGGLVPLVYPQPSQTA